MICSISLLLSLNTLALPEVKLHDKTPLFPVDSLCLGIFCLGRKVYFQRGNAFEDFFKAVEHDGDQPV